MLNALSVDLEEYFQVSGFERYVSCSDWAFLPTRLARNTERVLELLNKMNTRATFFIVGWLAEHHAAVVRQVAQAGHEIACHSYWHRLVYEMTPDEFMEDTLWAKAAIEAATGERVNGYRAPSYSVTPQSRWALDILFELGFQFDSSIFPISHDRYGWPGSSRFVEPIRRRGDATLWEFPPSTYPLLNRAVPVSGGGYLRILPYQYTKWALEHINQAEGRSACVYFHPWEIDPEQPRLPTSAGSWLRHSFGISGMEEKLRKLLNDFEFAPMGEVLSSFTRTVDPVSYAPAVVQQTVETY